MRFMSLGLVRIYTWIPFSKYDMDIVDVDNVYMYYSKQNSTIMLSQHIAYALHDARCCSSYTAMHTRQQILISYITHLVLHSNDLVLQFEKWLSIQYSEGEIK